MTQHSNPNASGDAVPPAPPWLRATGADLVGLDFEVPILGMNSVDSRALGAAYQSAIGTAGTVDASPAARVFSMLAAVTGMMFRPHEPSEPFGPMLTFADGYRSAALSDFRAHVDVLARIAQSAKNVVLRARLADVSWFLDRKRFEMAFAAATAYIEIIDAVDRGTLVLPHDNGKGALTRDTRDFLRRSLQIGRAIGLDKPATIAARGMALDLRRRAIKQSAFIPALWFSQLDLDFGVTDPTDVARDIEALANTISTDPDTAVSMLRCAARAYHLAKKDEDKYRCQTSAAELLASAAQKQPTAMMASSMLSEAIAELHGVPGQKDTRKSLRHRLVDVQAGISEEMGTFEQELDLSDIISETKRSMDHANLSDKLFAFASLGRSPDPALLLKTAQQSIEDHPLVSLFDVSHHDSEGKVVHRTQGTGDGTDQAAIRNTVAQHEGIRRQVTVSGQIEVGRRVIAGDQYLSDDVVAWLLSHSAFVPPDLVRTFSRGFVRFFQGDFVSALYVLTPLLENSLRHVLKLHGHDVTIFDDASQTQQDRTISQLFDQMRVELDNVFGKAITTDIENVFLRKPGPHVRHALAHGLLRDGDPYGHDAIYGCWLLFRLCLIPMFSHRKNLKPPF
jgi:hypothetical protein